MKMKAWKLERRHGMKTKRKDQPAALKRRAARIEERRGKTEIRVVMASCGSCDFMAASASALERHRC